MESDTDRKENEHKSRTRKETKITVAKPVTPPKVNYQELRRQITARAKLFDECNGHVDADHDSRDNDIDISDCDSNNDSDDDEQVQ